MSGFRKSGHKCRQPLNYIEIMHTHCEDTCVIAVENNFLNTLAYSTCQPGKRRPVAGTHLVLKIDPVEIVGMHVCVCVCPRPRLLITSGVMWHDMKPI